ncbi:Glucose-6-phosphate/phosphate translocator 1, chloroplastic [Linum perenne]
MSKVAVSFTHIIKSGEPTFSVLVSSFLLGEFFPTRVHLSLLPIIGGCALSAATELKFNMTGGGGGGGGNLALVFRNIFSKKSIKGKSVSGMNYYACLSMLPLLILTLFAIVVEEPQMWLLASKPLFLRLEQIFSSNFSSSLYLFILLPNIYYMSFDEISPLTFSVGNTMNHIYVIVSSIIIFHTHLCLVNALGAAIAILKAFLDSQVIHHPLP